MISSVSRRGVLAGCAGGGVLALAGCVSRSLDAEGTVTEEVDATDIAEVTVETTRGDIDIRGSETDTVSLEGRKQAADEDDLEDVSVDIDRDGDVLRLSVDADVDGLLSWLRARPRVDLELVVPRDLAALDLTSTNGDIDVQSVNSDVTAEVTNGDINLDLLTPGEVTADTTNGDVTLEVHSPADVTVGTTNGDVFVELTDDANVTVEATNGDVEIELPATAEPELVFETTNGDLDVQGLNAWSIDAGGSIETTVGAGTHRIAVETTNGDLLIRGRE